MIFPKIQSKKPDLNRLQNSTERAVAELQKQIDDINKKLGENESLFEEKSTAGKSLTQNIITKEYEQKFQNVKSRLQSTLNRVKNFPAFKAPNIEVPATPQLTLKPNELTDKGSIVGSLDLKLSWLGLKEGQQLKENIQKNRQILSNLDQAAADLQNIPIQPQLAFGLRYLRSWHRKNWPAFKSLLVADFLFKYQGGEEENLIFQGMREIFNNQLNYSTFTRTNSQTRIATYYNSNINSASQRRDIVQFLDKTGELVFLTWMFQVESDQKGLVRALQEFVSGQTTPPSGPTQPFDIKDYLSFLAEIDYLLTFTYRKFTRNLKTGAVSVGAEVSEKPTLQRNLSVKIQRASTGTLTHDHQTPDIPMTFLKNIEPGRYVPESTTPDQVIPGTPPCKLPNDEGFDVNNFDYVITYRSGIVYAVKRIYSDVRISSDTINAFNSKIQEIRNQPNFLRFDNTENLARLKNEIITFFLIREGLKTFPYNESTLPTTIYSRCFTNLRSTSSNRVWSGVRYLLLVRPNNISHTPNNLLSGKIGSAQIVKGSITRGLRLYGKQTYSFDSDDNVGTSDERVKVYDIPYRVRTSSGREERSVTAIPVKFDIDVTDTLVYSNSNTCPQNNNYQYEWNGSPPYPANIGNPAPCPTPRPPTTIPGTTTPEVNEPETGEFLSAIQMKGTLKKLIGFKTPGDITREYQGQRLDPFIDQTQDKLDKLEELTGKLKMFVREHKGVFSALSQQFSQEVSNTYESARHYQELLDRKLIPPNIAKEIEPLIRAMLNYKKLKPKSLLKALKSLSRL